MNLRNKVSFFLLSFVAVPLFAQTPQQELERHHRGPDMHAPPPAEAGGITLEQLRAALGEVAVDPAVTRLMGAGERPRAPGMK